MFRLSVPDLDSAFGATAKIHAQAKKAIPTGSHERSLIKTLMIAAAFASFIGPPASAQSYNPDIGTGNIVPRIIAEGVQPAPHASFAQVGHASGRVILRYRGNPDRFIGRQPHRKRK